MCERASSEEQESLSLITNAIFLNVLLPLGYICVELRDKKIRISNMHLALNPLYLSYLEKTLSICNKKSSQTQQFFLVREKSFKRQPDFFK